MVGKTIAAYFLSLTVASFLMASDGVGEEAQTDEALRQLLCSDVITLHSLLPPLTSLGPLVVNYARTQSVGLDAWALGVPASKLPELKKDVLEWLIAANLVAKKAARGGGTFSLTEKGWETLKDWQRSIGAPSSPPGSFPRWESKHRTLYYGIEVIKQFRVLAPNQIAVIEAFQEHNWPARVDFPQDLWRSKRGMPLKRLQNDTVRALNRHQRNPRVQLKFRGDGTGTGVLWEAVHPDDLK
jgi:DNA-binding PadR family transcriptional regulator